MSEPKTQPIVMAVSAAPAFVRVETIFFGLCMHHNSTENEHIDDI